MHPFSTLTIGIFVAGYITARWDLVTRLYELAIFAWDHGVIARAAKGFAVLSIFFFVLFNNLFGIVPFLTFAPFSRVSFAYGLAALVWIIYIAVGAAAIYQLAVLPSLLGRRAEQGQGHGHGYVATR